MPSAATNDSRDSTCSKLSAQRAQHTMLAPCSGPQQGIQWDAHHSFTRNTSIHGQPEQVLCPDEVPLVGMPEGAVCLTGASP